MPDQLRATRSVLISFAFVGPLDSHCFSEKGLSLPRRVSSLFEPLDFCPLADVQVIIMVARQQRER